MSSYAQTNIQLFNQLHGLGYSAPDLTIVASAYDLARLMMTGRYRASGKTFIAHLVGTASILGSVRAASPLVAAGLLHSVYQAGDFGDDRPGLSDARRLHVRAAVGEQVEDYVFRYQGLAWNEQTIRSLSATLDGLPAIERDVVLLRVADELEEFLDLGILYCAPQRAGGILGEHRHRLLVEIAGRLGFPALATELARAYADVSVGSVPPGAGQGEARNTSYLLAPLSYQRLKNLLAARLASLPTNRGKSTE